MRGSILFTCAVLWAGTSACGDDDDGDREFDAGTDAAINLDGAIGADGAIDGQVDLDAAGDDGAIDTDAGDTDAGDTDAGDTDAGDTDAGDAGEECPGLDDDNACTMDSCDGDTAVHESAPAGTTCSDGDGTFCDGEGTCVDEINGCELDDFEDMTGMDSATIEFGGTDIGNNYSPKCLRISTDTDVTFTGDFDDHPLVGGTVEDDEAMEGGMAPLEGDVQDSGDDLELTFSDAGLYPYYCGIHYPVGMTGVILVE